RTPNGGVPGGTKPRIIRVLRRTIRCIDVAIICGILLCTLKSKSDYCKRVSQMRQNTFKLMYLSMLICIGLVLHVFENMIPIPFIAPGAKLGLANIASLLTLYVFGLPDALLVSIIRSVLGTLLGGAVSSLLYSLSGAITSTIVMWIVLKYFNKYFSMVGVSIFGALAHNAAQVTVSSLIINNINMFANLPVLSLLSLGTGFFVGLASNTAKDVLKSNVEVSIKNLRG
ncbi:MAG: Gx transporter family protein, partial [Thermoanaerobacteraceae bacterium]|nr:Gx transporter family protein [Thermoanaerobacteraceae bacterium]